jgi:hypothetical protein
MRVRMRVPVVRVRGKPVPVLIRRFRRIAGVRLRSLSLLVHPQIV